MWDGYFDDWSFYVVEGMGELVGVRSCEYESISLALFCGVSWALGYYN